MTKERLVSFTDGVLAIIMTILILDIEKPSPVTLDNLWSLRLDFLAYLVSFFALSILLVNMHKGLDSVVKISNKVIWNTIFLLFFSSFFPYVTSLVAHNFHNKIAQGIYGIIILAVTIFCNIMYKSLAEIPENKGIKFFIEKRTWVKWDITIKIIGFFLTLTVFTPAVIYCMLATHILFAIPIIIQDYMHRH